MEDRQYPSVSADEKEIIERYGATLVNTGGNDPADLIHRLRTDVHLSMTNIVVFVMASDVESQVKLLLRLKEREMLNGLEKKSESQ